MTSPRITDEILRAQLSLTLGETDFADLPALAGARRYDGKVRDNYSINDRRVIIVTDRISAFDVVLGTIPFKGQVLNGIAAWWFRETKHLAPNHVVEVRDPQVTIALECTPLPVEFVMRAYLTGVTSTSVWSHYEKGARTFCGHALPDGMKKNQPLPRPILTPSTKAPKGGHDVSVSREELLQMGAIDAATFDECAEMVERLFAYGQRRASERGLILVDTKYEIGRAKDGRLVLIDEIHTPDSSRYWHATDYEQRLAKGDEPRSIDKEYVRRWLADQGYKGDGPPPALTDEVRMEAARRYIAAYELMTGESFIPDTSEPNARIRAALAPGVERSGA